MPAISPKQVIVSRLPEGGRQEMLKADATCLEHLASETGVAGFQGFNAHLAIKPWGQTGAVVAGKISAAVVQECVNTLEPVNSLLDFEFTRYYLQPDDRAKRLPVVEEGEMVLDPDEEDWPDEIENDRIDLWEIILEELNLRIDPFAAANEFDPNELNAENPDANADNSPNPFAELKTLLAEVDKKQDQN